MDKLTSVSNLRSIFAERGLAPNRKLGQSFLVDASVLRRIVDAVGPSPDDYILEIGPGAGALTGPLAESAAGVMAIEVDRGLHAFLEERFSGRRNVRLVHADVLKCDINALLESWLPAGRRVTKVVSNLPFCITTPVIEKFLRMEPRPDELLFTVQKELAARLTASPGSRTYGRITLMVNYFSRPEVIFTMGSVAFWPRPKVDSALVKFRIEGVARPGAADEKLFFSLVRAAFHQRRRMLRNSLVNLVGAEALEKALAAAGLLPTLRPERLSVEDFARLADAICDLKRGDYE